MLLTRSQTAMYTLHAFAAFEAAFILFNRSSKYSNKCLTTRNLLSRQTSWKIVGVSETINL